MFDDQIGLQLRRLSCWHAQLCEPPPQLKKKVEKVREISRKNAPLRASGNDPSAVSMEIDAWYCPH